MFKFCRRWLSTCIARPGDITKEDIESVLGEGSVKYNEEVLTQNAAPISPGNEI